jgi:tetratricopeptide (TPR) repeat protein
MRRLSAVILAVAASVCVVPDARGGPAEDCLDAPTVACVTEHFAEGADWPLRALRSPDRRLPTVWLLRALLDLGQVDEAERVVARAEQAPPSVGPSDFAAARFAASARAGTPDFRLLDGLAATDSPLAPLDGEQARVTAAWSAYWRAGYALLGQLAADAGVAEARDAPVERRAALRESLAWRGVVEGVARWNERTGWPDGWGRLAHLHLEAGDLVAAREALERVLPVPARHNEWAAGKGAEVWWRLGDSARADAWARLTAFPQVLRRHLERVAREAVARGDNAGALTALEEAWGFAVVSGQSGFDFGQLRRLVRLTAEADDHPLAVSRGQAIRELPYRSTSMPEAHWADAAAALNDIGAHEEAARMLRDLLALRPDDLAAAGLGAASPPGGRGRPGHSPRVRMVTELFRAGLRDAAEGLLRVTVVRNPMGPSRPTQRSDVEWLAAEAGQRIQPELADRIAQAERLSERAKWPTFHTPNGALQWSQALEGDAAHPERVAGLLALLSDVPAETRVSLLLAAARGDAKHGRFDEAAARLAQATTLLAPMDRPYEPFCRAMAQAARLGRGDLADMAFRASVAAARGEPEAVRAAILLDAAACRAVPHH